MRSLHRDFAVASPIPSLCCSWPGWRLHRQEQGTGLGADLLRDALLRAIAGSRQFGARAVVVDAIDDRAFTFYQHHGFLPFPGQQRLYRRIGDLERSLGMA